MEGVGPPLLSLIALVRVLQHAVARVETIEVNTEHVTHNTNGPYVLLL